MGACQVTEEVRFKRYTVNNNFGLRIPHPKVGRIVALASDNITRIARKTVNILLVTVDAVNYGPKTTFGNHVVNSGNAATMNRAAT